MPKEVINLIRDTAPEEDIKSLVEQYLKEGYTEDEALEILRQLQYV